MYNLTNKNASVTVKEMAAEITSFISKDTNIEYMWQGNPEFWAGRNPILFPIVGNTWSKDYQIEGKTYSFKSNHGFARSSNFSLVCKDEDSLTLRLKDNEDTYSQYPFHFTLDVEYKLINKRLTITYTITNNDEKDMPFGFGLHPAFNCPMVENEKFTDYYIEFSNNENQKNLIGPYVLNGNKINLNYEIFKDNPTLIFENLNSCYVSITNGKHKVSVSATGYKWFGIWTKENAPYVCLEPWMSHSDFSLTNKDFYNREGTIVLKPETSYTISYTIEID